MTRPPAPAGAPPALGAGPEFDRIRRIARELGPRATALDDDCVLLPSNGEYLALSTDVSVEGVHFRHDWLAPDEIGWRAAAAALSDLAADGAEPLGLLVALTLPRDAGEAEIAALMSGVGAAAAAVGALVLGGDLSTGPALSLAVTVLGRAARPVTRAGARPGDRVWLTGNLGAARAALDAWRREEQPDPEARRAFARPRPRIAEGRRLAAEGARAMLDLSDGLAGDASHLAAASGVALIIDLDTVPVAPSAEAAARLSSIAAASYAAEGGEDFELLAALPPEFAEEDGRAFERDHGTALTRIGRVEAGSGVRFLLAGRELTLHGFDHFV